MGRYGSWVAGASAQVICGHPMTRAQSPGAASIIPWAHSRQWCAAVYKAVKGVETVAVKACGVLLRQEDQVCLC